MFKKITLAALIFVGSFTGVEVSQASEVDEMPEWLRTNAYGYSDVLSKVQTENIASSVVKVVVEHSKELDGFEGITVKDDKGNAITPTFREVETSSGTGFFVSEDLLVTNEHVVDGKDGYTSKISALYMDGYVHHYDAAEVVAVDEERDLALLRVKRSVGKSYLSLANANKGDKVTSMGFPQRDRDSTPLIDDGIITDALNGRANIRQEVGNSGSPVLNAAGEVVGVVYALDLRSDGVVLYLPSAEIVKFIAGHTSEGGK